MEVFEGNDPEEVKISKNTCLEGTSLAQTASFEPSCVRIGCVVWAVDRRKKKKYITACAVALCSVKEDFSSEGKTLKFDCSPGPNPVSDHNQT